MEPIDDDMDDSWEIHEYGKNQNTKLLADALALCRDVIQSPFKNADAAAIRIQRAYKGLALAAALGTVAVVAAILQLASTWAAGNFFLRLLELASVVGAGFVVVIGMGGLIQKRWLKSRYEAERLRLLKFEFLTRHSTWAPGAIANLVTREKLADEVRKVSQSAENIEAWASGDAAPDIRQDPKMPSLVFAAFRKYYLDKRLDYQKRYLHSAAERCRQRHSKAIWLPFLLFVLSVVCVVAHFCVELAGTNWEKCFREGASMKAFYCIGAEEHTTSETVSRLLIAIAAALPVIGAGVRIHRGAFELGRQALRFESGHGSLAAVRLRLVQATQALDVFREIGFSEHVLETDNREWMRIMMEAEWFL